MHFHIQSLTDHSHRRLDASQLPSVSLFTCEAVLADSLSYFRLPDFFFSPTTKSAMPQSEGAYVGMAGHVKMYGRKKKKVHVDLNHVWNSVLIRISNSTICWAFVWYGLGS